MTTTLGAPFIPPDEVTITNSNGQLATKTGGVPITALAAGTQGDILYAKAAGVWEKLAAGTSGQFLKTQGAGANPTWADQSGEGWVELANYTNATLGNTKTVMFSGLAAYDQYLIVGFVETLYTGGTNQLHLFINDDSTAARYIGTNITSAPALSALSNASGDGIPLVGLSNATSDKVKHPLRFFCHGISSAQASGKLGWLNQPIALANSAAFGGYYLAGNATQITGFSARSNSGTVNINVTVYGRNL